MQTKIELLEELKRTTETYKNASKDKSIDDLCYPIDYANAPFYVLEKLGCDVEKMSEHCTINHYDDQNIVSYLEDTIQNLIHEIARKLIDELCDKYGYNQMSLDEFQMQYSFDEDDAKNIDDLLKLF